jgi:formimidoylglutamate deiminase
MDAKQGWLPDYLWVNGDIKSGTALFTAESGIITRFSQEPGDLAAARRLKGHAVFPGLVNVHSHSFQRVIRGRTEWRNRGEHDTFWTWRDKMYDAATRLTPEQIYQTARAAFLEMVLSGITTVGEFHYLHHRADGTRYDDPNLLGKLVVQAAREVGLRIVLLRTAYLRAGYGKAPNPGQTRFITGDPAIFISDTEELSSWVRKSYPEGEVGVGVAPHSVRAVTRDYLREIVGYARQHELRVQMHVSEQPGENEACIQEYGVSPVTWLQQMDVLGPRFTAVHAIHISEAEAGFLAESGSSICACPTSERNLADGAVRADWLLAGGANLCLGSDSQIQIDLLEDARLMEYHLRMQQLERVVLDPATPGRERLSRLLYEATSKSGAKSLGQNVGELAIGKPADFVVIDLDDPSIAGASPDTLLAHVVFSLERTAIKEVYVGGQLRVVDGKHPLQEDIISEFKAVQERFWRSSPWARRNDR